MYYNSFTCKEDIASQFQIDIKELEDIAILFASYGYESYDGDAIVIFRKDGKLYEVHGSHCSCNGLEEQWFPQETTYEAVVERYKTDGGHDYISGAHGSEAAENIVKSLLNEIFEKDVLH
jgi:hypothetical protein